MNFKKWFESELIIGRYPLPQEVTKNAYDIIINVSDEYIYSCHYAATKAKTKYYWFPMSECIGDMGLNSIYAALQILYIAYQEKEIVLLHCHAGANRSPTVADCFYYIMTGEHKERFSVNMGVYQSTGKIIETKLEKNRLQENSELGHLPPLEKMEAFLKNCLIWFEREETRRGGGLDTCKHLSNIS